MEYTNEVTLSDLLNYCKQENISVGDLNEDRISALTEKILHWKSRSKIMDFVNKKHVNKRGLPRAISKPSKEGGLWYTADPRNIYNKIRGISLDAIYDKLYRIYSDGDTEHFSVEYWYRTGIEFRIRNSHPRESTIDRYNRTKNAYFSSEFLGTDIRMITSDYIRGYMEAEYVKRDMSLKELKQLKGTLNVIFDAASDPEIGCLKYNPVKVINPSVFIKNNVEALNKENAKMEYTSFSNEQIEILREEFKKRIEQNRGRNYGRCKYALMGLMASYTGMRASELPALMWEDIKDKYMYVHQMQIVNEGKHGDERYTIVPWLKEEKGLPKGGRYIPFMDENLINVIQLVREIQEEFHIESEYLFYNCDRISYERSLYRLCTKLGFPVTNNHAFRKGLNMWMIERDINVAQRAGILGHSPAVNLSNYTVTDADWIDTVIEKVNKYNMTQSAGVVGSEWFILQS